MVNRFSFIQEHNTYDEEKRWFEVTIGYDLEESEIKEDIYYCPWCGKKLPIPYDITKQEEDDDNEYDE